MVGITLLNKETNETGEYSLAQLLSVQPCSLLLSMPNEATDELANDLNLRAEKGGWENWEWSINWEESLKE